MHVSCRAVLRGVVYIIWLQFLALLLRFYSCLFPWLFLLFIAMADNRNIRLSGAESEALNLGRVEIDPDLAQDVWAVGKLLCRGDFQPRALKSVLQRAWGSSHYVDIRELNQNLFLFRFANTKERNFAVRGGPWLFNRFNVILQPFRVHEIPSQVPLVQTPYWVQVHNLPVWLRKQATTQSLG